MVEKVFLALDFPSQDEIVEVGLEALKTIKKEFGDNFVKEKVGVKLNLYSLIGKEIEQLEVFNNKCSVFADTKIKHGPKTGGRVIDRVAKYLSSEFFTVDSSLGPRILKQYVEKAKEHNAKVIAFTVHTKISREEAKRIYNNSVEDVVYKLGLTAIDGGCDAIVLEARLLGIEKIKNLLIKKLVTGIRIDPKDKGTQARVSSLDEVKRYKESIDYVVVSSRYLKDPEKLKSILYSVI